MFDIITGSKAPATAPTAPGCEPNWIGVRLMSDDTTWYPVAGASGYEITRDGRVRSLDRWVKQRDRRDRWFAGRELKQKLSTNGYLVVSIREDDKPKAAWRVVHQLMCRTFHGPRPSPKHQVRHLNDDRFDNRADNLAWGTRPENAMDTVKNGNHCLASRTHCKHGHEFAVHGRIRIGANGRPHRLCVVCMTNRNRIYAASYPLSPSNPNRRTDEHHHQRQGLRLCGRMLELSKQRRSVCHQRRAPAMVRWQSS